MSEPQPAALADLARALKDLGWTIRWQEQRTCFTAVRSYAGRDTEIFIEKDGALKCISTLSTVDSVRGAQYQAVYFYDDLWPALDAYRAWQAPPRPDAAAFRKAVEREQRVVDAIDRFERAIRKGDPAEYDEYVASRAALLAFAPSADAETISEADVEAGAYALFCDTARSSSGKLPAWDELAPVIQDPIRRQVRIVLEAVAAARQRATGSGVRA